MMFFTNSWIYEGVSTINISLQAGMGPAGGASAYYLSQERRRGDGAHAPMKSLERLSVESSAWKMWAGGENGQTA